MPKKINIDNTMITQSIKTSAQHFFILILLFSGFFIHAQKDDKTELMISEKDYNDAVYASWIGQIIGNTYGLCYEFKFIDEPGPDKFPYGYTWTLNNLKEHNGAFSDDDTDIEYMYLTQMEKNGIEPNYFQLASAWKTHIKKKVWCANRVALTLMHAGHYPPVTGSKSHNPQWCQIDPQLVNEIWAVTAPGMINYAVEKSEFTARITNDSFGLEPTLHYAAMYSSAFFEKDIHQLIDIGTQAIGKDSKFGKIVSHIKKLYQEYPKDWKKARKIVKDNYYVAKDYNKHCWPVVDANLNGAYGIMALLYGQGDFQKTLDYSCAFGMDADNQAATMCGLLGIVNGLKSIPEDLMYPIQGANWEKPFNNTYKMVTREGLKDATLTGMAKRMALQGEKVILKKGGKVVINDGEKFYLINSKAKFIAPFELNPFPKFSIEINKHFEYPIYTGGRQSEIILSTIGNLPPGIKVDNKKLIGSPKAPGKYQFQIIADNGKSKKLVNVYIKVHSENLSKSAIQLLYNENAISKNIEIIRDQSTDQTYYSIKRDSTREPDYYGYKWQKPQKISSISYNNGVPKEYCGWFTTFEVEYLVNGQWKKTQNTNIDPKMDLNNSQWLKPNFADYEISFEPVVTKAIRIKGIPGGIKKDPFNAHLGLQYYSSISELRAYSD